MLVPSIFRGNLFDDWMDFSPFRAADTAEHQLYGKHAAHLMRTDVREHEDRYELDIDLPGFKKEDLQLELQDGYLTVSASKGVDKSEKDKNGKMIRQERYAGAMQRTFFVGETVTEEDVKAKFEDGVLRLTVPKKTAQIPEKRTIMIEG